MKPKNLIQTSHKNNQQSIEHPTIFSISIFESAQQFMAVYLGLQSSKIAHKKLAAKYLQKLLQRTKSPPIALTYTKQFTLLESESQIQLSIIRFISQLSDLSVGKSMQSSLSFMENGSFLTQLRHNLTHRIMVKGIVIERGKQMILNELKEKYWQVMFDKIWSIYYIEHEKVQDLYNKIISSSLNFKQFQQQVQSNSLHQTKSKLHSSYFYHLQTQNDHKLSHEYLFNKCLSNYEFKNLIKKYIVRKVLSSLTKQQTAYQYQDLSQQVKENLVKQYFSIEKIQASVIKNVIIVCQILNLIKQYSIKEGENKVVSSSKVRFYLSLILIGIIKQIRKTNNFKNVFSNKIVLKKLRQIYFFKYLKEFSEIIQALPYETVEYLSSFWKNKEKQIGNKILMF